MPRVASNNRRLARLARPVNRQLGFTLIELMIVVAMIGVLGSVAIPTYDKYIRRSRRAEATQNLGMMFKNSAAYYQIEKTDQDGTQRTHCIIDHAPDLAEEFDMEEAQSAYMMPGPPFSDDKKITNFAGKSAYKAFGFADEAAVYYHYSFTPMQMDDSRCGVDSGFTYVFFAGITTGSDDVLEVNYSWVFSENQQLVRTTGVQEFRGSMEDLIALFGPG